MRNVLFALFVAILLAGCTVAPVRYVPVQVPVGTILAPAVVYVQPVPVYYGPVWYAPTIFCCGGGYHPGRRDGKWWRW